jgi:uncharacterized membrane protein YcaP (DUF421 family)
MSSEYFSYLAAIAVRTAIVLGYLFLGLRLLGKRHINPMHVCDLAFIMAMANAVQNAMTNGKGDLSVGITSAGTLLIVGAIATAVVTRSPKLEKRIIGTPTVLLHDGVIERVNMEREGITEEELLQAAREHDVANLDDVRLAVLEVNGTISIISKD